MLVIGRSSAGMNVGTRTSKTTIMTTSRHMLNGIEVRNFPRTRPVPV